MPHSTKRTKKAAAGVGTIRQKTIIRNGKEYTIWEARYTEGIDPGTGRSSAALREKRKRKRHKS